jgi:hypothetical protein
MAGSTMTSNLNMMKDAGYISGWYKCETAEEERVALAQGRLIYTGSKKADRRATYADKDYFAHFQNGKAM